MKDVPASSLYLRLLTTLEMPETSFCLLDRSYNTDQKLSQQKHYWEGRRVQTIKLIIITRVIEAGLTSVHLPCRMSFFVMMIHILKLFPIPFLTWSSWIAVFLVATSEGVQVRVAPFGLYLSLIIHSSTGSISNSLGLRRPVLSDSLRCVA